MRIRNENFFIHEKVILMSSLRHNWECAESVLLFNLEYLLIFTSRIYVYFWHTFWTSQRSECCWIAPSLTKASSKRCHMEIIPYNFTREKKKVFLHQGIIWSWVKIMLVYSLVKVNILSAKGRWYRVEEDSLEICHRFPIV